MKYVCQLVLRQTKVNNKELNIKPIYQININNFDKDTAVAIYKN